MEARAALIGAELLEALDEHSQITPLSQRLADFSQDFAYVVAAEVKRLRQARGERPVGRKISLVNRAAWADYPVDGPIWGYLYDTTVRSLANGNATFDVVELSLRMEPRLATEIAFGISRTPEPEMDEIALLTCIDWVAHGFEIVQSLFPKWQFEVPDAIAAFALHGASLMGPRRAIDHNRNVDWLKTLGSFEIILECDGKIVSRGHSTELLGGPLSAFHRLVKELAKNPTAAPLGVGEIVTTGTLTRAPPVAAGQKWWTALRGIPLEGNAVKFA